MCLTRRQDFPVLDTRRIVTIGRRVVGNGIPRLLGPIGEKSARLLEGLGMLGVLGQVGELMRVVVDLKEFLGRARVGEDLVLIWIGFARGMSHP